jgi:site-specific recombinase
MFAIYYLVTDGSTVAIPSTTLVTVFMLSVTITSYTYLPGEIVAVLLAGIVNVISPFAVPVIVAVIVIEVRD